MWEMESTNSMVSAQLYATLSNDRSKEKDEI